jgi:hypothetical protein
VTPKQNTVVWLGVFLIVLNLVSKWSEIKSVIFSGAAMATTPGASSTSGGGGFTIPSIPLILPLAKTTPTPSNVTAV